MPQMMSQDDDLFKLISSNGPEERPTNSTFINNFWIENDFNNILKTFDQDFKAKIKILYLKYPEKIYKIQKRPEGRSEQRIEDGELLVVLEFHDATVFHQVDSIKVAVKRTKNLSKECNMVDLQPQIDSFNHSLLFLIAIDLDTVYEVNGRKFYELMKNSVEEFNSFHLVFYIYFKNAACQIEKTKDFLLVGKKTSPDKCMKMKSCHNYNNEVDKEILFAEKVVSNHIRTKMIHTDSIFVGNSIETSNGDIAYHFVVSDSSQTFSEGEIVGLVADDIGGKPKVVKLSAGNVANVLKGVVTRSHYLAAHKPVDINEVTETVCMLGVVPVRTQGSVVANEPLYASSNTPGVAVSASMLSKQERKEASVIGYSFQSRECLQKDDIGLVQAAVSVLSTVSQSHLNKHIRNMNYFWSTEVNTLKSHYKSSRKRLIICSLVFLTIIVITGILFMESFVPGTSFRYYLCKKNAITEQLVQFRFNPGPYVYNYPLVSGVEFDFKTLMDKRKHNYLPVNDSGARYYLNIDRCAYGGVRSTRDLTTGDKQVYGPDVFAIDSRCVRVYFYDQFLKVWREPDKVSWEKKCVEQK